MATLNQEDYNLIPFHTYETLEDKFNALWNGEVLFIKKFEKREGADVLARIDKRKYPVTQISYDKYQTSFDSRGWNIFNLGMNDLALFTCFRFEEGIFQYTNRFMINDMVNYVSVDGRKDSALIEGVYVSKTNPSQFAYKLSRDEGLYAEEELSQYKYM
jgi:hypothetical protein